MRNSNCDEEESTAFLATEDDGSEDDTPLVLRVKTMGRGSSEGQYRIEVRPSDTVRQLRTAIVDKVAADGERDKFFDAKEALAYGLVDEVAEFPPNKGIKSPDSK